MEHVRRLQSHAAGEPIQYRANQIHGEMLSRLLRATMPFFSKTRAGSIVQRFGGDLWEVSTCNYSVLTLSHKLVYSEFRKDKLTQCASLSEPCPYMAVGGLRCSWC